MQRTELLDRITELSTLKILSDSDWVDGLLPLQIEELATFFQGYTASAGTVLFMEGEVIDFFCLICEGYVDVVKENSFGKLKKLKSLGSGKVIGEMAFFDHSPSSATIIVKSNATLLVMGYDSFKSLCTHSPHIAIHLLSNFIRTISARLRETSGKLIDLL